MADLSAALDRLIETGPDGFGTMEREQRHKKTEAKLQNLHDENRARAKKLNWVHELAEVADKEAEFDAELEPEAERDTREALAVDNINPWMLWRYNTGILVVRAPPTVATSTESI